MTYDQRTRDYIEREQQEGKGTKEILRCLKRAIAREVFTLITNPSPLSITESFDRSAKNADSSKFRRPQP